MTKRLLALAFLALAAGTGGADAGYVQSYVDARGGCEAGGPGVFMSLDDRLSIRGERMFLGKLASDWTDADLEEYRRVYTACARRWNVVATGLSDDPGGVALDRKIETRMDEVSRLVLGKARQARQAELAAEQAMDAMARAEAAAKRERMLEQGRRERERAAAAAALAEQEAPMIAEAERQYADAVRAREAAEERLNAARNRVQAQHEQREVADRQRAAALAEQQRIERGEADRAEEAELKGKACRVSLVKFEQVRYGMGLRQVQRTFGCLGRLANGTRVAGVGTYATYVFQGSEDTGVVSATFRGPSLESKSQIGLD